MDCQHLDEIYELYLLGALDEDDSARVQEHLERGCPNCLEHLREAALAVYFLCLTARPVRPRPQRRSQLLRRLRKK
jgi:predicted anti-sigma-YlaC factor YlaD